MHICTTYIGLTDLVENHATEPTERNFDYQMAMLQWVTERLSSVPNLLMLDCEMNVVALTTGTFRPAIAVRVRESLVAPQNGKTPPAMVEDALAAIRIALVSAARKIMRETSAADFAAYILRCANNCTQLRANALRRQITQTASSLESLRRKRILLDQRGDVPHS
ncbi:MAG: hypothetical protein ACAI35_13100 [Candidatus Methylacidiphilales bacterium]|nr:hypothetical protein [Candidatus Methylacidiphilales bacterium]